MEVILHHLGFPLPNEDDFNKNKYCSFKSVYYSFCDDYGVNGNEIWINGNCFYVTKYDNSGDEGKSPPDIFTLWILTPRLTVRVLVHIRYIVPTSAPQVLVCSCLSLFYPFFP